jgi:hypothetical protein
MSKLLQNNKSQGLKYTSLQFRKYSSLQFRHSVLQFMLQEVPIPQLCCHPQHLQHHAQAV